MRRTLVGRVAPALALVAVATLVVACGGSDAPSESASAEKSGGAMTLTTWGGAYQIGQTKAFATPFGDESGAKVTVTSPTDYAKLKSMVKTGNVVWDVVDVEPFITRQGCEEGWLEKVDQTNIPQDAFLASMKPSPCGVPNGAYTTMIAFQPDKFTGASRASARSRTTPRPDRSRPPCSPTACRRRSSTRSTSTARSAS
jgi:putative spermidine/putrescine transport system substrate-binding protein